MIIVIIRCGAVFFFFLLCLLLVRKKHKKTKFARDSVVEQRENTRLVSNVVVFPDDVQVAQVIDITSYLNKHRVRVRAEGMPSLALPLKDCCVDQGQAVVASTADHHPTRGIILSVHGVNMRGV